MAIYRCKNCGQLVEPERNRICPACRMDLAGNMIKEKNPREKRRINPQNKHEGSRIGREIKNLLLRFVAGLIFLYVFFGILIPKWTTENNGQIQKVSNNLSNAILNSVQNQAVPSGTEKGTDDFKRVRYKYYINKDDVNLLNNIYVSSTNKTGILEFSVKTYWNGDVWINGPIGFVPFGTIKMQDTAYPLLYPMASAIMSRYSLPNSYDDITEYRSNKDSYMAAKNDLPSIYYDEFYNGKTLYAVAVIKNTKEKVILQNVTLHYEFAENKKIQIMKDGKSIYVYETTDGTRYEDYFDIPHELIIDEVSEDTTILLDSIEVEVK